MLRGKRPRFWITRDASMRLPNAGTASEFAKALQISRKTMNHWIYKERLPCCRVKAYIGCGHSFDSYNFVIDRIDFLEWARQTGRFDGQLYINYVDQVLNGSLDCIPPQKKRR